MKLCLTMTVRSTFQRTLASDILQDLNKGILLCTGHKVFTRSLLFRILSRDFCMPDPQDRFQNYFS